MAALQILVVLVTSAILCSGTTQSERLHAAEVEIEALRSILALDNLRHKWSEIENTREIPLARTQSQLSKVTDAIKLGVRELLKLLQSSGDDLCTVMGSRLAKKSGALTKNGDVFELTVKSGQTIGLGEILPVTGLDFNILSVQFDCSSYKLAISTLPTGTINVISNFMSIDQVMMTVDVVLNDISNTLAVSINGNWNIGSLGVKVALSYTSSSGNTVLKATPSPETTVKSFIQSVTGLSLPISPSVNFGFSFIGQIASNGFTTLTLSNKEGESKFYAVYQKQSSDAQSATGIAVEVKNTRFSTIIQRVINLDIASVPFFGSLSVNDLGLSFGTDEVIDLQDAFTGSPLFERTQYKINKGLTAYITVPFHDEPLTVTYDGKELVLTTPSKNLRLDRLLEYLISSAEKSSLTFPSQIPSPFRLNIETIQISSSQVMVSVSYATSLSFLENIFEISAVSLAITVSKTKPTVTADFSGSMNFAGVQFNTQLSRNEQNKYVLSADGSNLDIQKVISAMNAEVLPSTIYNFLKNIPFLKFSIRQAKLVYNLGTQGTQITGIPTIQGFEVLTLEAAIMKVSGKRKIFLGFELGQLDFAGLLKTITGFNFGRFTLLRQTINAAVSISPIASNAVHFTTGNLASLPITKGISVIGSMQFPSSCGSDVFCKFAGILVGKDTVFKLQATISSSTDFPIRASLEDLSLGSGVVLGKAGIEIVGGTSARIGLVGEVALNNPPLIFAASISAGTKGLTMELSVTNCWENPFGANWLSICNLLGSVDFAPPTGITGFAIGAEIHLGYESTGHQIKGQGYVGVSIINPVENYYYVNFNRLTLGSLLKAFRINSNLPKPIAESGFPREFLSSYSATGKELPQVQVSIPAGFRLKGTLNILGLQGDADITIDLPQAIDINVALPPIQVSNLLTMSRSRSNTRVGPNLMAKVQVHPFTVNIEANGYLQVLGMSLEARLKITDTLYEYSVSGKILQLFEADMKITATYGNIKDAKFQVKGEFKSDLFNQVKQSALTLFSSAGNKASQEFDKAYAEVKRIENLLESAEKKLDAAWDEVKKLGGGKVTMQSIKCFENGRCKKVYSQGRFTKRLRRAARRAARRVSRSVSRTVSDTIKETQKLLDSATDAYNKIKDEVNDLEKQLKQAEDALEGVTNTFKSGLAIIDYIRKRGLNGIINIKRIWFDVSLEVASGGKFSGGVEMEFFGSKELKPRLSFNLRQISNFGKALFQLVENELK